MEPTGLQKKRLMDALLKAFPEQSELERLVAFYLDENLNVLVGGKSYGDVVFNLIKWAIARGKLTTLMDAACIENPDNSALREIYLELYKTAPVSSTEEKQNPEKIILPTVHFTHVAPSLERQRLSSLTICRIELSGMAQGTGFLVGPDVMMTNYHVIEPVVLDPARRPALVFRFQYLVDKEGNRASNGLEYQLDTIDEWLISSSREQELDYVLLRVTAVDKQQIDAKQVWLTPQSQIFVIGEPLHIMQHPRGNPLQNASGAVSGMNDIRTRVYYNTNTLGGSSGSPCFNNEWSLVALHRAANTTRNEGVPFTAILTDLQRRKLLGILGEPQF